MDVTVYFCGCIRRVGHYTYDQSGRMRLHDAVGPWKHLDTKSLHPNAGTGAALLTHLDGWTALGIADRTVDSRGNSHSTFATEGTFTFDEMLGKAREAWPQIIARIEAAHPITEFQG